MFLAFGLFIIACGGTHFMEVVTIWIPVYVVSAVVKVFTALASVTTAVALPVTVPRILTMVRQAKLSEEAVANLRASEERKEALLREVHHRVKNNMAVICSLFYLQSMHTTEERTIQIFQEMENRVHTMALVHQSLYSSENLARIDFAEYAQSLAGDILASLRSPDAPVRLKTDLEPVIMSVDLALPCGLILSELISNACKHGFPNGTGEVKLTLRSKPDGKCSLLVEDSGRGIPSDLDVNTSKSLGLRLVRLLAQQIHGSFEVHRSDPGTAARLEFWWITMHAENNFPEPRALIIEDEVLIAEELREHLSRLGFSVIGTVDSADEGVAIATRERPDLVLMDIRLKGKKDGIEAAREIRQQVDLSIVYLTAYSDQLTVDRVKTTEHDGFILKPFHRHDLESTIEIAMQRHAIREKDRKKL